MLVGCEARPFFRLRGEPVPVCGVHPKRETLLDRTTRPGFGRTGLKPCHALHAKRAGTWDELFEQSLEQHLLLSWTSKVNCSWGPVFASSL